MSWPEPTLRPHLPPHPLHPLHTAHTVLSLCLSSRSSVFLYKQFLFIITEQIQNYLFPTNASARSSVPQDTFYFSHDIYHFFLGSSYFCDIHISPLLLHYNLFEDMANSPSPLSPASLEKNNYLPHICCIENGTATDQIREQRSERITMWAHETIIRCY